MGRRNAVRRKSVIFHIFPYSIVFDADRKTHPPKQKPEQRLVMLSRLVSVAAMGGGGANTPTNPNWEPT